MTQQGLRDIVYALAEPLVRSCGLEIWGVEVEQAGRTVVRVFIDSSQDTADSDGATLDQCEDISRQLSLALDVENEGDALFSKAWVLEVSTPGMSRTFFRLEQMKSFLGDIVVVRLNAPLSAATEGRRGYTGELVAVDEKSFTLRPVTITEEDEVVHEDRDLVCIPWSLVRKAHVRALFPRPPRPGKGPSRPKS